MTSASQTDTSLLRRAFSKREEQSVASYSVRITSLLSELFRHTWTTGSCFQLKVGLGNISYIDGHSTNYATKT
jgi:hypothetical protein